ncbi:MAG: hypothetical protein GX219_04640 [Tissierellia bacterium]|nr:hypothetical protein [Tissierellia bacterium]
MKKKDLYPPGLDISRLEGYFIISIICAILFSFLFISECNEVEKAMKMSYDFDYFVLKDFKTMVFPYMWGFVLIVIFSIFLIPNFYGYFSKGSMSVYTMKRLKNPMEIHRRALFYPVMFILITSAIGLLALKGYHNIYLDLAEKIARMGG